MQLSEIANRFSAPERFRSAIARFDSLNDQDPNRVADGDSEIGYELFFSRELTRWTLQLRPDASEALLLAARSQHLRRWESPRDRYPMDRAGYLKWRSDLKIFHAEQAGIVLNECHYDSDTIDRVRSLNLKRGIKADPECQTLEDALCLVFLEKQFATFRQKTDREKMIDILRKTWGKMSDQGHAAALSLAMGPEELALVQEALA